MDARTNRLVQFGLGTALLVVVIASVVFIDIGDANPLPDAIQSVAPVDGSQVPRQQPVVIDLAAGFEADLLVRDRSTGEFVPVDPERLQWEPATGVITWSPPEDATPSGNFVMRVEYRAISGLPEQGAYEWTIRTY